MSALKYRLICIFLFFLFVTCSDDDIIGYVVLIGGYENDVMVHTFYDYDNTIIEDFGRFWPGKVFHVNLRQRLKYSNITEILIETPEGEILAEYTPDYLLMLRNSYPRYKNNSEAWVFTEKGLFIRTAEIAERYGRDTEGLVNYYRSDEAVQELEFWLEKAGLLEEFREKYL